MRVVGGKWKGRVLEAPVGRAVTRPTTDRVREALASMLMSAFALDVSDVSVLDAFGGSGAMGIEMLSRGCKHVTFFDNDRLAAARIKRNVKALGAQESEVHVYGKDVFHMASDTVGIPFDCVIFDPPYKTDAQLLSLLIDTWVSKGMLADGAYVLYERDAKKPQLNSSYFDLEKQKKYGSTAVDLYRMNCV